jgi:Poly-adenylate binding protein, unique domain
MAAGDDRGALGALLALRIREDLQNAPQHRDVLANPEREANRITQMVLEGITEDTEIQRLLDSAVDLRERVSAAVLDLARAQQDRELTDDQQAAGERLFPFVQALDRDHAGKITGMFLDSLELAEVRTLTDDTMALKLRVDEAQEVLKIHF